VNEKNYGLKLVPAPAKPIRVKMNARDPIREAEGFNKIVSRGT